MSKEFLPSFNKGLLILFFMLLISPIALFAQTRDVKGVVRDASTGETLIGVTVVEKGTTNGTMTDLDGSYTLKVPQNAILLFSYVGYQDLELPADKNIIDVKLDAKVSALDEVVVVGYGVQKKSVVTAAISGVKAEDLGKTAPTRVDNLLKGQVSGVSITQQSGQPGEGSKVRIRGIGTINNSDPLYIVDGMPVDAGIDYLNPADIESVEILKDAASAAIYGTRGANGVILVTTKKGKIGKATVNYNMSYGWQNPWKRRDVLNAAEYLTVMQEMGNDMTGLGQAGTDTDWQEEVFNKNAPIVNHQLSVSGGNDKSTYFLSFGYLDHEGIVGGNYGRSNYNRYSFRINNDYIVFDEKESRSFLTKLKLGVNASYSRIKSTGVTTNDQYGGVLAHAIMAPPIFPVTVDAATQDVYANHQDYYAGVKDPSGQYYYIFGDKTNEIVNPIASMSLPGIRKNEDKLITSFWAELDIFKGLSLRSTYGADFDFWGNDYSSDIYYLGSTNKLTKTKVTSEMNRGFTWQVENTLTYNTKLNDVHNFTALLGQSAKVYRYRSLEGEAADIFNASLGNIDASTTSETARRLKGQMHPEHKLASYFARLNYNYDERYMAELTIRRDGSSNFSRDHQWANFPSVSAGWNVTNEKFMENRPAWLTNLKLRGSWGKNGNENIEPFNYLYLVGPGANYPLGDTMTPGIAPDGYYNLNTKWEESEQLDFGLDSYLLDGAVSFSFDWFKKKTNGMLMRMTLPNYIGALAPYANVGDMSNTGVEFDASYRFNVSDVNFRLNANASYIKNKLVELGNAEGWENYDGASTIGTITRGQNGEPFPYFYGRVTDGIFQTDAEAAAYVNNKGQRLQPDAVAGDVRFVDVNKDGTIDDNDRTKIGKGMPDWTFGFNVYVDWKGFDLSANFQGTLGNDIFDATRRTDLAIVNMPSYTLDRWHGEGTSNKYPRLAKDNNKNWESSDLYVHDGSFVRLRTLQLGYTLPRNIVSKAFIQNMRIFASFDNLLTITSYDGYDPEISSGGTSLGIDRGIYPQPRTFSLGANITF